MTLAVVYPCENGILAVVDRLERYMDGTSDTTRRKRVTTLIGYSRTERRTVAGQLNGPNGPKRHWLQEAR